MKCEKISKLCFKKHLKKVVTTAQKKDTEQDLLGVDSLNCIAGIMIKVGNYEITVDC